MPPRRDFSHAAPLQQWPDYPVHFQRDNAEGDKARDGSEGGKDGDAAATKTSIQELKKEEVEMLIRAKFPKHESDRLLFQIPEDELRRRQEFTAWYEWKQESYMDPSRSEDDVDDEGAESEPASQPSQETQQPEEPDQQEETQDPDNVIPFDGLPEQEHPVAEPDQPSTTLTPAEREAFERITEELRVRGKEVRVPYGTLKPKAPERVLSDLELLELAKTVSAENPHGVREEKPLRAAPGKAARHQRQKELHGIMVRFRDCDTDTALWKLIQKEISSLVKKLNLAPEVQKPRRSTKGKAAVATKSGAAASSDSPSDSPSDQPPSQETMDVYAPIFTHLVQISMRRLLSSFSSTSPMAFNMIPHLKSYGIKAYALGVSTTLFNDAMRMHWHLRGDLPAVLELVDEMERLGLQPDFSTVKVLDAIRESLAQGAGGQFGPFTRAMIENMPQYAEKDRLDEIHRRFYTKVVGEMPGDANGERLPSLNPTLNPLLSLDQDPAPEQDEEATAAA